MKSEIQDYMLNFMIPFQLQNYDILKAKNFQCMKTNGWEREEIIYGESDLYEYVKELMSQQNKKAICSSWRLERIQNSQEIYATKVRNAYINWRFEQIGLILFDTAIGIMWYRIKSKRNFLELEEVQEFIYEVKELARGKKQQIYKSFSCLEKNLYLEKGKFGGIEIIEKKEYKAGVVVKGIQKVDFFEDVLYPFFYGLEIDTFFINRNKSENEMFPDKAIPFSWVLNSPREIEDLKRKECVFRLGRGYTKSYSLNTKTEESKFFKPFDDSIWYASLEGCANYIVPQKESRFYSQGYKGKICNYFYLFLLCMGQYYSSLKFTQSALNLSTESLKELSNSNCLEKLLYQINTFNITINYSQVGGITQYNEFYKYLRLKLNIEEMNQSLDKNLKCLYEMAEQKRNAKKTKMYRCVSIISGMFFLVELFGNLAQVLNLFFGDSWKAIGKAQWGIWIIMIITGISIIGILIGIILLFIEKIIRIRKEK